MGVREVEIELREVTRALRGQQRLAEGVVLKSERTRILPQIAAETFPQMTARGGEGNLVFLEPKTIRSLQLVLGQSRAQRSEAFRRRREIEEPDMSLRSLQGGT